MTPQTPSHAATVGASQRLRFFNTQEPVSPLYRDFLPFLAQTGHRVDVLMASRTYRAGEWHGDDAGIHIRHLPTGLPGWWPRPVTRAWTHGAYAVSAALASVLGSGVDANVFLTQPPLFAAWGRVLEMLRGQPYGCLLMDLYPWVAIRAGVLAPGSALTSALWALAVHTLRHARAVMVIGRCMAEQLDTLGVARERIHLVHNWADTEVVRPVAAADNPMRRELGLAHQFVVMYSGNLGVSHDFDDLLTVAERLGPDGGVTFLVAGDGARRPAVERAVHDRRLGHVRFIDHQDYARLAQTLSVGDVHFVSLRSGFEGLVVPSKAYGICAAGRPIIYQGADGGEIARMIGEEEIGLVVPPEDPDALFRAVVYARAHPDWRRCAGVRARAVSEGRYSKRRAMEALAAALATIRSPGP